MKKLTLIFAVLLAFVFVLPSVSEARRNEKEGTVEEVEALLNSHQIGVWVEGEVLGDLLLSTRGRIDLVYIDDKMSDAIGSVRTLPVWFDDLNQYHGSEKAEKKALFFVQLDVHKPWKFDIKSMKIGDYSVKDEDIVTGSWRNPEGELPSESKWTFAFAVPEKYVKKNRNKVIKISYGKDAVEWKVPR